MGNKPSMYCCKVNRFYIKPQRDSQRMIVCRSCKVNRFYIKPQHDVIVSCVVVGCKVNRFYIKPQLAIRHPLSYPSCKVNRFYIKPQPLLDFCLYIKDLRCFSHSKKANHSGSKYICRTSFANLLKKFQLQRCFGQRFLFFTPKINYFTILFVSYTQNRSLSFCRDKCFHTFYMNITTFL